MLTITPISAFQDNYIWALHDERHAVLVDPGDASPCIDFLVKHGLNLVAILVTHHHNDHVGGIRDLSARYHPSVYGPAREIVPALTDPVSGGDTVTVSELGLQLSVIDTPGHTLGHIAYYDGSRLFCGDTLFGCGCGRLFEGTPAMMLSSLNKIQQLPEHTQVFCAHEYTLSNILFAKTVDSENFALQQREQMDLARRKNGLPTLPSTLRLENTTNPFLRCDEPVLIQAAETLLKRPAKDAVQVFTALRQAKDTF